MHRPRLVTNLAASPLTALRRQSEGDSDVLVIGACSIPYQILTGTFAESFRKNPMGSYFLDLFRAAWFGLVAAYGSVAPIPVGSYVRVWQTKSGDPT